MEKLTFKLQQFEGPLDLLLHLISKNKIDIYDIPIAKLLEQYIDYIEEMKRANLEVASEFLELAARLVHIKTAMLLPKPEEAEVLRAELTGQLIEYIACKEAAEKLRMQYIGSDVFVRQPQPYHVDSFYTRVHETQLIYKAYLAAIGRAAAKLPPPKAAFDGIIGHEFVPVESKAQQIMTRLHRGERLNIDALYRGETERSGVVAVFLALLELIRNGKAYMDGMDQIALADSQEAVV